MLLAGLSWGTMAQVPERFKKNPESSQDEGGEEVPEEEQRESQPQPQKTVVTDPPKFWDKVIFGGNASASFGSFTLIYLSPTIGYKVRDDLILGGGFIYQYARISQVYNSNGAFIRLDDPYENQVYGPKVLVNYFATDFLYVGTQFEYLNHDVAFYNPGGNPLYFLENQWTPVLFLEAGYAEPIGNRGYIQIGLRYNVLHDFDSPYGSSWFPVIGFFF